MEKGKNWLLCRYLCECKVFCRVFAWNAPYSQKAEWGALLNACFLCAEDCVCVEKAESHVRTTISRHKEKKCTDVLGADDKSRTKETCFDDVQYEVKCWCGVGRVTGIWWEDGRVCLIVFNVRVYVFECV